jgi:hypothetical protein
MSESRFLELLKAAEKAQARYIEKVLYGNTPIPHDKNEEEEDMTKQKVEAKEYLLNGGIYFPNLVAKRSDVLPAGAYECNVTMEGQPFFKPIEIITDKIINLDHDPILPEIDQFWTDGVSKKFEQYGLVHKRGILVHGAPGTGKTVQLAKTAKHVVEKYGAVILFNPNPSSLKDFIRLIREVEPTKKILIMWEEFDEQLNQDESTLLSLLDGEIQVGNIVYLATTNYINKIPSRIKNRPSRFAKVIEIGVPSIETRRLYFEAMLHDEDKDKLAAFVQATDGFVVDQMKDLIISVCCFNYPISDAVAKIRTMNEESIGVDDYAEEQRSDYFRQMKKDKRVTPLQPLR